MRKIQSLARITPAEEISSENLKKNKKPSLTGISEKTASLIFKRSPTSSLQPVLNFMNQKILGQKLAVELTLATLLARGHILLEGPPGMGKTSLARTLALCFQADFNRIQMTSDLLPGEVVGIMRLQPHGRDFEFRKGPIFCNMLLADELNRTSPKTQAALLEAMAENTVTVDGHTHRLPQPFFVIATQNPSESHGVYPLAESQLDRFTTQVVMELPEEDVELEIYKQMHTANPPEDINASLQPPFFNTEDLRQLAAQTEAVFIEQSVLDYAIAIARASREHPAVRHGISIRGVSQFLAVAKGLAFLHGKNYVTPSDLQKVAEAALSHRLKLEEDSWETTQKRSIIREILELVKAPK